MRRFEVGFVFQAFHLMDELTAQENVELPPCWRCAPREIQDGGPETCSYGLG
jgi:predicted ABC-type transport system involved in lysophospholipase L1 biosynthesis ATPase subunit